MTTWHPGIGKRKLKLEAWQSEGEAAKWNSGLENGKPG